jgi:phage tail sheath protein FI
MSFLNSPGVYDRIIDKSFIVSAGGLVAGAIVISSNRGTTEVNTVTSAREFVQTYGLPRRDNPSLYAALRFLNRCGILSVRRVINDALTASGALSYYGVDGSGNHLVAVNDPSTLTPVAGTVARVGTAPVGAFLGQANKVATYGGAVWTFADPEEHLTITAENPGAWGNTVTVTLQHIPTQEDGVFFVFVHEDGEEVERYEVSRDPNKKDGYGMNMFIENVINLRSRYIKVTDNPTVTTEFNYNDVVTLSGGANDTVAPTSLAVIDAWDDFLDVEAVPANILINGGWAVPAIQSKMEQVASIRKDAIAILDVPETFLGDIEDVKDYRNNILGIDSNRCALYAGWLRVYDQYNDQEVTIPPSGDVAAVVVRTIEDGERWYAPAGMQRGVIPNVLGVTNKMTEVDRDMLYIAGVNPIITYAGAPAVIWGQKTLQKAASALDRLNVINTIIWVNQRMSKALVPFVFEPNTSATRENINFLLSGFLDNVKTRGGLYDYSVDTSEALNTPFVIDQNAMYVDVYLKPIKTAEFIRLSTIITPTGVQLG